MKNKTVKNNPNIATLAVVGAGIASVAAAAYFLLGSKRKMHQKHLKAWAIKMKGDIIEKIEEIENVSEVAYNKIIDKVAIEYKKGMKADKKEIDELANDLKKHWKTISVAVQEVRHDIKKDMKSKQKDATKTKNP
ncbi:MAG: hypothetical protein WC472_02440 [Candidatus Paceibacterota bacterium]